MCHTFLLRERESGGELGQIDSALHYSFQQNPLALRVIVALEEKIKEGRPTILFLSDKESWLHRRTHTPDTKHGQQVVSCMCVLSGTVSFMNKSEGSDSAANSDTQKFERPLHWFLFALLAGAGANIHYVPARLRILLALASL